MINQNTLDGISDDIAKLAESVKHAFPDEIIEKTIPFSDIAEGNVEEYLDSLSEWEKQYRQCPYIYIIKAIGGAELGRCRAKFAKAKIEKVEARAYARLNDESETLYVGSSHNISKRISEHFGLGYRGTYALQMKNWVAGLDGSVQISIARFDAAIDRSVLQAVEDGLWQMDQPMFGRRGAR